MQVYDAAAKRLCGAFALVYLPEEETPPKVEAIVEAVLARVNLLLDACRCNRELVLGDGAELAVPLLYHCLPKREWVVRRSASKEGKTQQIRQKDSL